MVIVSILLLILILGLLITAHEFGHFITAKLTGIRVYEFAVGMGPKIWKKQKGETLYTIRALPIGGFCAMEEDEEPDPNDARAFPNAKRRHRALVLAAGSIMNFAVGLILLVIMNMPITYYLDTTLTDVSSEAPYAGEDGFLAGDRIVRINGHSIYNYSDVLIFFELGKNEPYDFVLERDSRRLEVKDIVPSVINEKGNTTFGFSFGDWQEATLGLKLKNAWYGAVDNVRIVWVSLGELIGGRAGVDDLAGPVAMGGMVDSIVQNEDTTATEKTVDILNLAGLIAINLAVMNLLPLPALDGGRLLFLAVEGVRRKRLNPKYEGWVHTAGFVLFLGLMVFVFFNDILRLFGVK